MVAFADDDRIRARAGVFSTVLDGEAVLLDPKSGKYFGLNEVGARIWTLLQEGASAGGIRRAIVSEYDVGEERARADVVAILTELESRDLVVRDAP
jgi:hypothetical protein